MEIDPTTLSDLEVLRSPDGSGGVFQLVDRTHTSLGRRALRRRFERPMCGAEEIRRTQAAVRFLMRHPRLIRLEEESLAAVDGVRATRALFRRLSELCRSIERHAPPALVAELTGVVGRAAQAVLPVGLGQGDVPGADGRLRGELREDVRSALDAVAELDALAARARSTAELGWTQRSDA